MAKTIGDVLSQIESELVSDSISEADFSFNVFMYLVQAGRAQWREGVSRLTSNSVKILADHSKDRIANDLPPPIEVFAPPKATDVEVAQLRLELADKYHRLAEFICDFSEGDRTRSKGRDC